MTRGEIRIRSGIIVSAVWLLLPVVALAQTNPPQGSGAGDTQKKAEFLQEDANAMDEAYDNWEPWFRSNRTPHLFADQEDVENPNSDWRRVYPSLDNESSRSLIAAYNHSNHILAAAGTPTIVQPNLPAPHIMQILSTDDEIKRTTMAVYKPVHTIQEDYLDDQFRRDGFLDYFSSLRGIANITLSYLDATLAASLATTQQQADQETQSQILKQISWSSSRLANPHREHLYKDTDEKVEACLAGNTKMGIYRFDEFKITDCITKCGDPTGLLSSSSSTSTSTSSSSTGGLASGNPYTFCTCCAEVVDEITRTTVEKGGVTRANGTTGIGVAQAGSTQGQWDLVDSILYGVSIPNADTTPNDPALPAFHAHWYITNFSQFVKDLYGTIIWSDKGKQFVPPRFTPDKKIKSIRDGCAAVTVGGSPTCPPVGSCNQVCPITGLTVHEGVYQSLKLLLMKPPATHAQNLATGDIEIWIEASLGYSITAEDIQNILITFNKGQPLPETTPGSGVPQEPTGALKRFLNALADAQALGAFKRMHVRTKTLIIDHLTMNQRATSEEKRMMLNLIARIDAYIRHHEQDLFAEADSVQMMTGLTIRADRIREVGHAAAIKSHLASRATVERMSGVMPWGALVNYCQGPSC